MSSEPSRRRFMTLSAGSAAVFALGRALRADDADAPAAGPPTKEPPLEHELVGRFVGAAHRDLEQVKALLLEHPTLLNAAWDWGGGDWETAIGAAAHTGRRPIAQYLLEKGARIDLFAAAMLGEVELVTATVEAFPEIVNVLGPHGIPLWAHALAGGPEAVAVLEYLDSVDALRDEPLDERERRAFLGLYRIAKSVDTVRVYESGSSLMLQRPNALPAKLLNQGGRVFRPASDVRSRFIFDVRRGRASSLEYRGPSDENWTADRVE